ncbi:MAG: hypothetical protein HY026_06360 [Deltaproteobacteria bacterium]|nr:hypothetical protein [Deltaproteobacteria bacterium]
MPARSERIYICPDKSGDPGRIMVFPAWWDRSAFLERYRNREIDPGNPIDVNVAYLLSSAEAIAWNEQCAKRYSKDFPGGMPNVTGAARELESVLMNASWVIVESYEWESGMD